MVQYGSALDMHMEEDTSHPPPILPSPGPARTHGPFLAKPNILSLAPERSCRHLALMKTWLSAEAAALLFSSIPVTWRLWLSPPHFCALGLELGCISFSLLIATSRSFSLLPRMSCTEPQVTSCVPLILLTSGVSRLFLSAPVSPSQFYSGLDSRQFEYTRGLPLQSLDLSGPVYLSSHSLTLHLLSLPWSVQTLSLPMAACPP